REEKIADRIRHDTIDLFGHLHVARAKACLHVRCRNPEFLGDDTACKGRIHISDDDHNIWLFGLAELLKGDHDAGRLLGVATRTDALIHVRTPDLQDVEKGTAHLLVVMLARMDEHRTQALASFHRLHDRRDFHEIWPRAAHQHDFSHLYAL